ncbi:hypothetical protein IZY60_13820 [Lutibacter sp. B2]|nr:hypothetical protein [Lutibacter sp. B2]MBF8984619.1 hypothetical protein [Lutibacter sp. B2]
MKKLVSMILCGVCFLSFGLTSFGEEITFNSSTIELENTILHRSKRSTDYLYKTDCDINFSYKNGKLNVSGHTKAFEDVDKISVEIFIQKYNEKSRRWETFKTILESEKNSDCVRSSRSYSVGPGKYRAKSYHELQKGQSKESGRNTTNSIKVN